jgi:hypothetical protein
MFLLFSKKKKNYPSFLKLFISNNAGAVNHVFSWSEGDA